MSDPRWHEANPPSRRAPYGDREPDRASGVRRPQFHPAPPDGQRTRETGSRGGSGESPPGPKRGGDDDPRARTRRTQPVREPGERGGRSTGRPSPNGSRMRRRSAGRGGSGRRGPQSRWGELRGGAGVGIVAGSALLGALITIVLRQDPGAPLGVILVLGTLAAGLAVRARSARLIIPAPVLCYIPAGVVSGAINDRAGDTSTFGLMAHGGKWISSGFVAMCVATIVAVVITGLRMYLDFRARPRTRGGPAESDRYREDSRRPRPADELDGPTRPVGQTGPSRQGAPAGTGPRRPAPGTGPYGAPPGIAPPAKGGPPAIGPGRGTGPAPGAPGQGGSGQGGSGGWLPPGKEAPRGTGPSRPRPGTGPYPPRYPPGRDAPGRDAPGGDASGRGGRYNFSSGA